MNYQKENIILRVPACGWLFIGLIFLMSSCTKIRDLINPPSPREVYEREFAADDPELAAWQTAFEQSMNDSIIIQLPYRESGNFFPGTMNVYSYNLFLEQGEIFLFEIVTGSPEAAVFIDFFRETDDSLNSYKLVEQKNPGNRSLRFEVTESDMYKIIVQPAIGVQTPFVLTAYTQPTYEFPVADAGNSAIKSFWGASRDGGSRSHEGVDIFAPRGTPVIAATDGRVSFTGDRGLGGKQVWLRTRFWGGKSLYYAHLNRIAVSDAQRVSAGDTLGFVGNSGNARTTSPHLHFGIYGSGGAVDPLPYIRRRERPETPETFDGSRQREVVVHSPVANLRMAASLQGKKIGEARNGDILQLLGSSGNWRHIKTGEEMKAYIHESLVE